MAEEGSQDYFIQLKDSSNAAEWLVVDNSAIRTNDSFYLMLSANFKGSSWNFN